jgi:hypothetical protein
MRTAFRVVGQIEGLDIPFGALLIIGDGAAPRVLYEIDVDYGRLGMAMMDAKLRPLSDAAAECLAPLLAAFQQATGDDAAAAGPQSCPAPPPPSAPHLVRLK